MELMDGRISGRAHEQALKGIAQEYQDEIATLEDKLQDALDKAKERESAYYTLAETIEDRLCDLGKDIKTDIKCLKP